MNTGSALAEDALLQALERSDAKRRPERAERIQWVGQYDIGGAIIGPVEAMNLLREARECFVEGHYIATLMLATALIEHVISEELVRVGKAKYGLSFESAIALARREQLFPTELLKSADKLRVLRNPFAHRKPDDHEHTLGSRYMGKKCHPRLIVEEDAKVAVVSMYGHFQHVLRGALYLPNDAPDKGRSEQRANASTIDAANRCDRVFGLAQRRFERLSSRSSCLMRFAGGLRPSTSTLVAPSTGSTARTA